MSKSVAFCLVALLLMISISGFADDQYVPTTDEDLYATWINKDTQPQKSVNFFGGYRDYLQLSDTEPTGGEGTEQIMSKWTDSAGDVWYKTFGTVAKGQYSGIKFESITKISKSGKVKETVAIAPVNFYNPDWLWQGVDPSLHNYHIFYRAEEKYVPTPNEELFATWTNSDMSPAKTVDFLGGWKDYKAITDSTPTGEGTEQIMSKRTDADGNIWYTIFFTGTAGRFTGYKWQRLVKISKSGSVQELVTVAPVSDFDPKNLPDNIDPNNTSYRIYYRSGD